MTPRQFFYHGCRHIEREKRLVRPFQFLATITARCAGNESADFMKDPEPETGIEPGDGGDMFEAYLRGRALHDGSGTAATNTDSGTQGTTGADETPRGFIGAGSGEADSSGGASPDQG